MAGTEGSGQTELLSGWSCVVHRPSEDPEPSSLPSTVDMAAFSAGPSVEPTQAAQDDSSDSESDSGSDSNNSGSDASGSCSLSESSDSDTSSSSQEDSSSSSPPPQEFSVSQSGGLRLTIYKDSPAIRKSCSSPTNIKDRTSDTESSANKITPSITTVTSKASTNAAATATTTTTTTTTTTSSVVAAAATTTTTTTTTAVVSSSAVSTATNASIHVSSSDTGSESDSDESETEVRGSDVSERKSISSSKAASVVKEKCVKKVLRSREKPVVEKKVEVTKTTKKDVAQRPNTRNSPVKTKGRPRKAKKMASLPLSRGSTCSSSDSEGSDADTAMLASCSLQEIRQEDLAAILPDQHECDAFGGFECHSRPDKNSPQTGDASGSDMELPQQVVNAVIQRTESSSESESHPPTLYANSLLQQFVAQTQLLNTSSSTSSSHNTTDTSEHHSKSRSCEVNSTKNATESELVKRKRGRPRKGTNMKNSQAKSTTESSSIMNVEYCGDANVSPDSGIQNSPDHPSSPEPNLTPSKTNKHVDLKQAKCMQDKKNSKSKSENLKKTGDISNSTTNNNKHSKLSVSCHKLDRVLYANADRVLYPPRKKAGRPVSRKGPGRPPKHKKALVVSDNLDTKENGSTENNEKSDKRSATTNLQSTGHKSDVNVKPVLTQSQKNDQKNNKARKSQKIQMCNDILQLTNNTLGLSLQNPAKKHNGMKDGHGAVKKSSTKSALLHEICERVSKRLELGKIQPSSSVFTNNKCTNEHGKSSKSCKSSSKGGVKNMHGCSKKQICNLNKPKFTTMQHIKVMHTKHKHSKHKKCKFKMLKAITVPVSDPKIHLEIDKLIADFAKLCTIGTLKLAKEIIPDVILKKTTKKRKCSDNGDGRKKKKQHNASNTLNKETNSNEQRLPLKKRHYHVSTNHETKQDSGSVTSTQSDTENEQTVAKPSTENKQVKPVTAATNKQVPVIKNKTDIMEKSEKPKTTVITKQEIIQKAPTTNCPAAVLSGVNNNNYNVKEATSDVRAHIDEAIEACITKYSSLGAKPESVIAKTEISPKGNRVESAIITATTPKKRHRLEIANAIENNKIKDAVINLHLEQETKPNVEVDNKNDHVESDIKSKKALNTNKTLDNAKKVDKKIETPAQINTRKKNRLEDLASNLVSKINPSTATEALDSLLNNNQKRKKVETGKVEDDSCRVSVIKSPMSAKKATKIADATDLLDFVTDGKPTGIFMPTVDIELHIPASTIQTASVGKERPQLIPKKEEESHNLRNKKQTEVLVEKVIPEKKKKEKSKEESQKTVKLIPDEQKQKIKEIKPTKEGTNVVEGATKKKHRRRKAINRTGFPTVKKKKKKCFPDPKVETTKIIPENETPESKIYERIPRSGEEYSMFMERTKKFGLSVIALEKLQETQPSSNDEIPDPESDVMSKWEVSSECDSLPLDERTYAPDFEFNRDLKHELPLNGLDYKQDSFRLREVSPATSIETRSSDRIKYGLRDLTPDNKSTVLSGLDLDDIPLEKRLDNAKFKGGAVKSRDTKRKRDSSSDLSKKKLRSLYEDGSCLSKRRLRDVSPASSIEPLTEKRLKNEEANSSSGDEIRRNKKAPRWRKKYLVAGLFSDYYKEDDESARARRNEAISSKNRLAYIASEHPYGLLPPPYHCGRYLRCRKVDFQLPHDLWWQHTHSRLPGRDLVPSWNYRKIRTNVYCVRNTSGACEPQACNCTTSAGCGDDCINRLVLAECPASHKCKNQKIQKHEWAPGIEKFMTENKGWGVRTKLPIKNGEFILEYVGEVVADQEFKQRMATRYVHDTHHYCLHLDGGLVIDGHRMGGDGRFVNHSCQPNCEMQKWSVNGQFRMALFALRDITSNEEITYDYNFSLFNPAEGQECKCGSENCRGVIGGKSQRVKQIPATNCNTTGNNIGGPSSGRVGRPRKNQAKRTTTGPKDPPMNPLPLPVVPTPQVRPMSHLQKCYVLEHHCFLLRNLDKVRRIRERSIVAVPRTQVPTPTDHSAAFLSQMNALRQPRNMRTRRLAQAEEDPELHKTAKLATVLRDLFNIVKSAKDEKNESLSAPFMNLPTKRKLPEYYQRITEPIDLATVEQKIDTGIYRTAEAFDSDMNRLFTNSVRYFGRTSELGIAATRLKKIYSQTKQESLARLESILGGKPTNFVYGKKREEEEDVIRCICGQYRDEGRMIQCDRCLVWQHCECVKADVGAESYHCERCVPRKVDYEIPLEEFTEHGHRYYVSLMRGDLQLRQGDTVYVLRDIPIAGTDRKHTYETIGDVKYADMDIFRIERLWKDSKTGQRFAYGHHYLRPHETYHEPTRKFFPNEVMRVPLYEVVPVELIMSPCWVLDLNTFCKGRPINAPEDHIYICEYRVDKTARLFSKISKAKYPVCTKTYAFERFDLRLKITRTYTPHDLDPALVKPRGRKAHEGDDGMGVGQSLPLVHEHLPIIRTREEQKCRLNKILLHLLTKLPTKQTLDVSYLLEGGRRRKKAQS